MDPEGADTLWEAVIRGTLRHKVLSLLALALMLGSVVVATWLTPEWFTSRAGLYFRLGRENSTIDTTSAVGEGPVFAAPASRDRELNSILEIMQSRALVEAVIEQLGTEFVLDERYGVSNVAAISTVQSNDRNSAKEKSIQYLLKSVRIKTADDANVIWLQYTGRSPDSARRIVQAYIDAYLERHVRFHRPIGTHAFLEQQTHEMLARLSQAEDELRSLQSVTKLVDPQEQRHSLIERIGRLELELLQSESNEQSLASQLISLQGRLEGVPQELVKERTSGMSNNAADKMREQLFSLQIKEQELLTKFTPVHPEIRAVHDQIEKVVAILAKEQSPRVEETAGVNLVQESGQIKLLEIEPSLKAAEKRTEVLKRQLETAQLELEELGENQLKISRLTREVELAEANYRKFSASLEQARLDEALESRQISNVSIIQPPTFEPKPAFPIWPLNLGLGLFASLGLILSVNFIAFTLMPRRITT